MLKLLKSSHLYHEIVFFLDLPPPEVSISRAGNPTAGEMFALTCSVTVVENLYTPPAIEWQYSNGSIITSGENIELEGPLSSGRMSNLTLRFNQIRTSDGGLYNCQATITIPVAAISDLTNASAMNVTVQGLCILVFQSTSFV